ncbi:MAG: hypothetical protein GY769_25865 [bacterium]|nr:hypothetical protein [bacterium]
MRYPSTAGSALLAIVSFVFSLLVVRGVDAQISPGELSRAHEELEGSGNCLQCHQSGERVPPAKCLSCHEVLGRRIGSDLGLHARPEYEDCKTCHIEHHGRDFELVWWGKEGREAFEHSLAGYHLEGAHATIQCEECHRPSLIGNPEELLAQSKALDRTYLGLDSVCLSCHEDEHRGQIAPDSCSTCHGFAMWKPASLFDHGEASFPLTGRHRRVGCEECHARIPDPTSTDGDTYLRFAVSAFRSCTDCHRDPHEGRLGGDCTTCHSTAGWAQFNRLEFDHDRTRFALEGAHRTVACEKCHAPGSNFRVARFDRCVDCHDDAHLGQFLDRTDGGICESCHTAERFAPASFTVLAHQETDYPLEGAHLATACVACHQTIPLAELAQRVQLPVPPRTTLPDVVMQFRFDSTECQACHQDPHRGEVDRWVQKGTCEVCHLLAGWRQLVFDHDLTDYPLQGRHAEVACQECHLETERDSGDKLIRMVGASPACNACHEDTHFGQLNEPDGLPRCEHCHGFVDWKESFFDHSRDSSYPLEGAHLRVACDECHPTETRDDRVFFRYKPLGATCEDCHTSAVGDLR